jgi:hypothetical protein
VCVLTTTKKKGQKELTRMTRVSTLDYISSKDTDSIDSSLINVLDHFVCFSKEKKIKEKKKKKGEIDFYGLSTGTFL